MCGVWVGVRGGSSVSNENVTCIADLLRPSSDSRSLHVCVNCSMLRPC